MKFFFDANTLHECFQPSNYQKPEPTFFSVLYRPLFYILLGIQQLFFKTHAYGYQLVSSIIHGINAALFYHILKRFFLPLQAFLCALYFLSHTSLIYWFGWITAQQHLFNVLFLLLAFIFFLSYQDSKRIMYACLSCFWLFLALLTRETGIVFSFFCSLFVWTFSHEKKYYKRAIKALSLTYFLYLPAIIFLGMRLYLFSFKSTSHDITLITTPLAFLSSLKDRFFDAVTLVADVTNVAWIPGNNRLIKGSLIGLVLIMLCYLFIRSKNKKAIA